MKKIRVASFRPTHIKRFGIGYAATKIAWMMNTDKVESDIFSIQSDYYGETEHCKELFNRFFYKVIRKILPTPIIQWLADARFLKFASQYDIVYLWPGVSYNVYIQLKKMGKIIVMDAVNCHQDYARELLDKEAEFLDGMNTHAITEKDIRDETNRLSLTDYLFTPSEQVTKSFLSRGFSPDKIIETSYGIDEHDLLDEEYIKEKKDDKFTALFVGSVIPRKGIHLLLDYWTSSEIKNGKLLVIGRVDGQSEALVSAYREHPTIEFIDFTDDLASYYKTADLFILPSIEEGSPLVTYMAIASGLPCLVSPMGSGGIIQHEVDGYVINPHQKHEWITALKCLSSDASLRKKMSLSARHHAERYIWTNVAKTRIDYLADRIKANNK